jgi:hypothetical protein
LWGFFVINGIKEIPLRFIKNSCPADLNLIINKHKRMVSDRPHAIVGYFFAQATSHKK